MGDRPKVCLDPIFNFKLDCFAVAQVAYRIHKQPLLELKTRGEVYFFRLIGSQAEAQNKESLVRLYSIC